MTTQPSMHYCLCGLMVLFTHGYGHAIREVGRLNPRHGKIVGGVFNTAGN